MYNANVRTKIRPPSKWNTYQSAAPTARDSGGGRGEGVVASLDSHGNKQRNEKSSAASGSGCRGDTHDDAQNVQEALRW
jgi:hypothetical protein